MPDKEQPSLAKANNNHYTNWPSKHRPQTLDDYIGNEDIKNLIESYSQDGFPQSILISGSTATGKTTLARIIGALTSPKVDPNNFIEEHDCVVNRGIDDIRNLIASFSFMPKQGNKKVIILEEAHGLSPQAMNAILKPLEEPKSHVIIILTTNEIHKIPQPIQNRCVHIRLQYPDYKHVYKALVSVAKREKIYKKNDHFKKTLLRIAKACEGDFRRAINALSVIAKHKQFNNDENDVMMAVAQAAPDNELEKLAVRVMLRLYTNKPLNFSLDQVNNLNELLLMVLNLNQLGVERYFKLPDKPWYMARLFYSNCGNDIPPVNILYSIQQHFTTALAATRSLPVEARHHFMLAVLGVMKDWGND